MAEVNLPEECVFPCVAIFLAFFLFLSPTHTLGAFPQTRSLNSWHCVKSSRIYNYSTNIQFPLPSWKILARCSLRDSWVRELRRREHRNKTRGSWRKEGRPFFPDFPCLRLRACWQWCANRCNNSQQCWDLQSIVGRIQPISLCKPCVMCVRGPNNVGRAAQTDPTLLRYASAITGQKKCWELLAEKFDRV